MIKTNKNAAKLEYSWNYFTVHVCLARYVLVPPKSCPIYNWPISNSSDSVWIVYAWLSILVQVYICVVTESRTITLALIIHRLEQREHNYTEAKTNIAIGSTISSTKWVWIKIAKSLPKDCTYIFTGRCWPGFGIRALRAPVFIGSLTRKTGRCASLQPSTPRPSLYNCLPVRFTIYT